jgi:hypothetical protein
MPTQSQILRKDTILAGLDEARQKILLEASRLTAVQQNQVFLGIWSAKDLLAHLIGWDHTNLQAAKNVLKGQVPHFYEHRDRDWQTYNAMLVKKYKTGSFEDLLAAAQVSQEKLLDFLRTLPPENFNKDFGVRFRGYRVTIQRLLEAETGDEQTHYKQITDFFKESK